MNATQEPPIETLELVPEGETIPMKRLASTKPKEIVLYDEYRAKIENLKKVAETLVVADASEKVGMKLARETRLGLKGVRVDIVHLHKELKADNLAEGRKIDKDKNDLVALIEPLEARMLEMEQFAERESARIKEETRQKRVTDLLPFVTDTGLYNLADMTDEAFDQVLTDAKAAQEARLAREQKANKEAAAKAKAESEERERIRLENIRLKEEAEAREAAAKKEREEAARVLAAEQDKARKEAAAAQKAREEEQARFEAEAKKERERVAAERAEAEAKAKKEREDIETKARAEREAIEAKAKADRAKFDEEARKQREAREKIEAELATKKAAEEKAEADRLAAIEAAALAPEKEKLTALAATVRAITLPTMTTEKGLTALAEIEEQVSKFAKYIEKKAATL